MNLVEDAEGLYDLRAVQKCYELEGRYQFPSWVIINLKLVPKGNILDIYVSDHPHHLVNESSSRLSIVLLPLPFLAHPVDLIPKGFLDTSTLFYVFLFLFGFNVLGILALGMLMRDKQTLNSV
jgi:hypothetical protein